MNCKYCEKEISIENELRICESCLADEEFVNTKKRTLYQIKRTDINWLSNIERIFISDKLYNGI